MEKRVTVYDVAKEAGVSPATVSRILTGSAAVSEPKRAAVEAVIQKYNYRPNLIARSLMTNQTQTIGFLLPDITNPFFSTMYFETEKCALQQGYNIILANTMSDSKTEYSLLEMLTEKQVDAIVFMGGRVNAVYGRPNLIDEMRNVVKTTPIVMINGKATGVDCYNVQTDEEDGMVQLVEFLISLGHRKIGILGGQSSVTSTRIKYNVLRRVLHAHNLPCRDDWIVESGFSMESGAVATERLLDMTDDLPSVLIGISDMVAIGIMQVLQKRHIRVPQDISVAGFDDTHLAMATNPNLTSVNHNYKEAGRLVVNTVIDLLAGRPVPKQQIVPTRLVVRDSCRMI